MANPRTPPPDATEPGTAESDEQAKRRQQSDTPLVDERKADENTTTDAMIRNKI